MTTFAGIETERRAPHVDETPNQQAGTDEEHDCQRALRCCQDAGEAASCDVRAMTAAFESAVRTSMRATLNAGAMPNKIPAAIVSVSTIRTTRHSSSTTWLPSSPAGT